jgi:acyl dehydratase
MSRGPSQADWAVLSRRRFHLTDQQRFAELSGDWNPVHLDAEIARRLMLGGVAVHGVHLLLWALDEICAANQGVRAVSRLRVQFERPVGLDEEVTLSYYATEGRLSAAITATSGRALRLTCETSARQEDRWRECDSINRPELLDWTIADLASSTGRVTLCLPRDYRNLFPNLVREFSGRQVAILLACTRLVGMTCPGRHSVFTGMALNFVGSGGTDELLNYRVTRADERVRLVDIEISAENLAGRLETLFRPPPVAQPGFDTLRNAVEADAFLGQRALVIGGSRGLGELTAKLLALGGAGVTITFHQGASDAARVVAEARQANLPMQFLHYDIAEPPSAAPRNDGYTHLYYFATPRISPSGSQRISVPLLERYLAYYVTGFAKAAEWARGLTTEPVRIFYPSTTFIEEAAPGFQEYVIAKACGETTCRQLQAHIPGLQVIVDRLPRLKTDQTQGLAVESFQDSVTLLRRVLAAMSK